MGTKWAQFGHEMGTEPNFGRIEWPQTEEKANKANLCRCLKSQ